MHQRIQRNTHAPGPAVTGQPFVGSPPKPIHFGGPPSTAPGRFGCRPPPGGRQAASVVNPLTLGHPDAQRLVTCTAQPALGPSCGGGVAAPWLGAGSRHHTHMTGAYAIRIHRAGRPSCEPRPVGGGGVRLQSAPAVPVRAGAAHGTGHRHCEGGGMWNGTRSPGRPRRTLHVAAMTRPPPPHGTSPSAFHIELLGMGRCWSPPPTPKKNHQHPRHRRSTRMF